MSNGYDGEVLKRFVGEIERHHAQILSYKGEHAQRVKSVQEMISDVYDRAKDHGVPKKELKMVIKERDLTKKIEQLRGDLEPEQAETFDQIKHALGMIADLPLGEATLARGAAIDSLTEGDDLGEFEDGTEVDEDARAGAENAAKLTAGISKLN